MYKHVFLSAGGADYKVFGVDLADEFGDDLVEFFYCILGILLVCTLEDPNPGLPSFLCRPGNLLPLCYVLPNRVTKLGNREVILGCGSYHQATAQSLSTGGEFGHFADAGGLRIVGDDSSGWISRWVMMSVFTVPFCMEET